MIGASQNQNDSRILRRMGSASSAPLMLWRSLRRSIVLKKTNEAGAPWSGIHPMCGVANGANWFAVCAASVMSVPMILRRVTFANLIHSKCSTSHHPGSAPERHHKANFVMENVLTSASVRHDRRPMSRHPRKRDRRRRNRTALRHHRHSEQGRRRAGNAP